MPRSFLVKRHDSKLDEDSRKENKFKVDERSDSAQYLEYAITLLALSKNQKWQWDYELEKSYWFETNSIPTSYTSLLYDDRKFQNINSGSNSTNENLVTNILSSTSTVCNESNTTQRNIVSQEFTENVISTSNVFTENNSLFKCPKFTTVVQKLSPEPTHHYLALPVKNRSHLELSSTVPFKDKNTTETNTLNTINPPVTTTEEEIVSQVLPLNLPPFPKLTPPPTLASVSNENIVMTEKKIINQSLPPPPLFSTAMRPLSSVLPIQTNSEKKQIIQKPSVSKTFVTDSQPLSQGFFILSDQEQKKILGTNLISTLKTTDSELLASANALTTLKDSQAGFSPEHYSPLKALCQQQNESQTQFSHSSPERTNLEIPSIICETIQSINGGSCNSNSYIPLNIAHQEEVVIEASPTERSFQENLSDDETITKNIQQFLENNPVTLDEIVMETGVNKQEIQSFVDMQGDLSPSDKQQIYTWCMSKILKQPFENGNSSDESHTCHKCGKIFTYRSYLERHIKYVCPDSTGRTWKCSFCGKAFQYPCYLRRHIRSHTGESPYKCDKCDRAFVRSTDLQRHIRNHTGEKPYRCSECERAFARSTDLKRHMRTHTGEKPYKCWKCGKSFSQSGSLQTHLHTHNKDATATRNGRKRPSGA